jgi:hypothetical protein
LRHRSLTAWSDALTISRIVDNHTRVMFGLSSVSLGMKTAL